MKIGSIIANHWASESDSTKYFVYTGIEGKYATGIGLDCNGTLIKLRYYKSSLKNDIREGHKAFEPVGYCNGFDIIKEDLKSILG